MEQQTLYYTLQIKPEDRDPQHWNFERRWIYLHMRVLRSDTIENLQAEIKEKNLKDTEYFYIIHDKIFRSLSEQHENIIFEIQKNGYNKS